jgi:hypothetical protein
VIYLILFYSLNVAVKCVTYLRIQKVPISDFDLRPATMNDFFFCDFFSSNFSSQIPG